MGVGGGQRKNLEGFLVHSHEHREVRDKKTRQHPWTPSPSEPLGYNQREPRGRCQSRPSTSLCIMEVVAQFTTEGGRKTSKEPGAIQTDTGAARGCRAPPTKPQRQQSGGTAGKPKKGEGCASPPSARSLPRAPPSPHLSAPRPPQPEASRETLHQRQTPYQVQCTPRKPGSMGLHLPLPWSVWRPCKLQRAAGRAKHSRPQTRKHPSSGGGAAACCPVDAGPFCNCA